MIDIVESIEAIQAEIQNNLPTNRRSRSLHREQVRRRARNRSASPFAWQSNVSNLSRTYQLIPYLHIVAKCIQTVSEPIDKKRTTDRF